jgi:mono/diheme cytochrome c family protein
MKRIAKWLGAVFGVVVVVVAGALVFLFGFRPVTRPPSTEIVERTPARLARGTYLVENLLACKHCHSPPDTERYGLPVPAGMSALSGGIVLDRSFTDFPGVVQAPNITPDVETGIGRWTDGEIIRAIREGVKRDGTTIFPMMPYAEYRAMSDEDARSIVVYLRAQPPVRRKTVPTDVDFMVSLFMRLAPEPVDGPVRAPAPSDHLAYGRYLVRVASCKHCHTPQDKGQPIEAEAFSGGFVFQLPTAIGKRRVVTANITSDPTTGYFGRATKQQWIDQVRSYVAIKADPPKVQPGANTMMPWLQFSGLTDEDLGAIYDYMKTVRPVRKLVRSFPDVAPGQTIGSRP